jgi:hypothetical protein
MGILGFIFRAIREAVQEKSAKNSLENKLGRKVSNNDLYSLGAHLDATPQTNAVPPPMQSTPREASVPFGDAKPPMKTSTKLLLIGIPLVFIGLIFVSAVFALMSQRQYNRLNPFTPKPPAGSFPSQLGTFNLKESPDYNEVNYYTPVENWEGVYTNGTNYITYKLWNYKSDAELNTAFDARKKYVTPTSKFKVLDDSGARYVVMSFSGSSLCIVLKDGMQLKELSGGDQKPMYEFEGFLKNAPPAAVVPINYSEMTANNNSSTNSNSSSSTNSASLTVGQLLEEFKKDSDAADKKYKNKMIIFTGTAEFADKDKKGEPMVGFLKPGSTKPADGMVVCSFDKSQEAAVLKIKKGDAVKLQGKVMMSLIGNVMLENCSKL